MRALPLVAPAADPSRPYTLVDDRLWFVDTGASRTTCDDDFVASLGVRARPTLLRSHGEVGSVPIRLAVLRDVTIGGWTFRRLPCAVRDLATTSSLPDDPTDPVAGILGANLFRTLVVDFDFTERRLRLHDDVVHGLGDGVPVRRERGVGPRLVAPLLVDGARVDVVVDTGADRTYLPLTTGNELARYTAERQGTGPGGATPVEVVVRAVESATIAGRPVPLGQYVFRHGRPGLLGMDALGVPRVVVDAPRRRLAWTDGVAPALLAPDEARRAALEADGSPRGQARLAAWETWRGDADRAVDLYARLDDHEGHALALLVAGRWDEGRAAASRLGDDALLARLVRAVERGAEAGADHDGMVLAAEVLRRAEADGAPLSGAISRVGERLLAMRARTPPVSVPPWTPWRGPDAEVLDALAREGAHPGAAVSACARLPVPRDAEEVLLVVACGQRDRATEALAGMTPGAVVPAGMPVARARAAWLDARGLLATAAGDPAAGVHALELALRLAPWDPYLHARRAEARRAVADPAQPMASPLRE